MVELKEGSIYKVTTEADLTNPAVVIRFEEIKNYGAIKQDTENNLSENPITVKDEIIGLLDKVKLIYEANPHDSIDNTIASLKNALVHWDNVPSELKTDEVNNG